ncbi:MAG: Penicillin-binding protein 2 [candidate division TM6 bacterium GW2011_GWF2_28_16]|nr:MAG: Penicillin-binding protein 2 [candidate division TM6 bacterium GW2011_GWF2_28_16]
MPLRGNIVDCNNKLLASNMPIYDLYWNGTGEYKLSQQQDNTLEKVSEILNINFLENNFLGKIVYNNRQHKNILIKKDITFDQLSLIFEQCSESRNLFIETNFSRFYIYKNLASHILGYLSRDFQDYTTKGISGLESAFQEKLKGESGYILNVTNSKGRKINQVEVCQPKQGQDLKLTIDVDLQLLAETIFNGGQVGAFILMSPKDGAIRAIASFPNFDPNVFLKPISQDEWNKQFIECDAFLNRATTATYPPASIFKIVTYAAGIEDGFIDSNSQFNCHGYVTFCDRKYHCIRHTGHGKMDAKTALAYSCNIPCFLVAQKMKINDLADYAFRFGLGRKTGFLLGESAGLVPTYEWKKAVKGESWWKGETLSASIGQSYTLVTPLQMVRVISAIFTGFLVRPRILEEEEIETSKLNISPSTINFLRDALKGVVLIGSAERLGRIKDFDIYAKTGTAQTSSLTIEKKDRKYLEHAWLTVYFRYKNEDPLAMVVLVEHVGSSGYASQMAAKFLRKYKKFKETGVIDDVDLEIVKNNNIEVVNHEQT